MASILDILNTPAGKAIIEKAGNKTSEEKGTITSALSLLLPLLLTVLQKQVRNGDNVQAIDRLLEKEKYGSAYLNHIQDKEASEISSEGEKILDKLIGTDTKNLTDLVAGSLQIKQSSVKDIMQFAAFLLMNVLASQKEKEGLRSDDLTGLLETAMGSSSAHDSSLVETLMSKIPDARVSDEIEGMVFGGNNKGKKRWDSKLRGMTGGK